MDAAGDLEGASSSGSATRRTASAARSAETGDRPTRAAGGDVAEHDVRVGDRGLLAAEAVTGGPGHGSGAARPDLECAGGIEPRETAPTRPDLGDVDGRDPDKLAAAPQESAPGRERRADLVLLAARDAAGLDQRGLRGRAAHVEVITFSIPEPLREPERRDDARRRPRLQREDGPSAAAAAVITPPDDCMIVSGAAPATSARPLRMSSM